MDRVARVSNAIALSTHQTPIETVVPRHSWVAIVGVSQFASISRMEERGQSGAFFQRHGVEYLSDPKQNSCFTPRHGWLAMLGESIRFNHARGGAWTQWCAFPMPRQ